jgi:hypothetical protein
VLKLCFVRQNHVEHRRRFGVGSGLSFGAQRRLSFVLSLSELLHVSFQVNYRIVHHTHPPQIVPHLDLEIAIRRKKTPFQDLEHVATCQNDVLFGEVRDAFASVLGHAAIQHEECECEPIVRLVCLFCSHVGQDSDKPRVRVATIQTSLLAQSCSVQSCCVQQPVLFSHVERSQWGDYFLLW